jgi:hypothetical protein
MKTCGGGNVDWFRSLLDKAVRVAAELVVHGLIMMLVIGIMRVLELWMGYLWKDQGESKELLGIVKLTYIFDAVDLVLVLMFAVLMMHAVWTIFRGSK